LLTSLTSLTSAEASEEFSVLLMFLVCEFIGIWREVMSLDSVELLEECVLFSLVFFSQVRLLMVAVFFAGCLAICFYILWDGFVPSLVLFIWPTDFGRQGFAYNIFTFFWLTSAMP